MIFLSHLFRISKNFAERAGESAGKEFRTENYMFITTFFLRFIDHSSQAVPSKTPPTACAIDDMIGMKSIPTIAELLPI